MHGSAIDSPDCLSNPMRRIPVRINKIKIKERKYATQETLVPIQHWFINSKMLILT